MLRRLMSEDIGIDTAFAANLGSIEADAGQMEQVVMNLCLNARDAMPSGGTLRVEAQNVTFDEADCAADAGCRPGQFVRLSVADTGCGMTPEVRAHLFEPFFTTKPAGAGTGLGLATVYGIVQQAGGFILVESETGRGTTVHVCLPLAKAPVEGSTIVEVAPADHRGGETVLLVEDDEPVRMITCLFLEANGYQVLQADSGPAALRLASQNAATIHLLLSDVVMPEMSGGELARKIVDVRPDIKILFMSGYNEDDIVNHGLGSSTLLQKPFTEEDLVRRIRETLDGRVSS
jgi:CheY-like chemotaxis protein